MPYDPRSVSEGGNRGIDIEFSRKAPPAKFRVVGVDTFDGTDWHAGDFLTAAEAIAEADRLGAPLLRAYVYDEQGDSIHSAGLFGLHT